eukprot:2076982-Prymnesium_polylepis.1
MSDVCVCVRVCVRARVCCARTAATRSNAGRSLRTLTGPAVPGRYIPLVEHSVCLRSSSVGAA